MWCVQRALGVLYQLKSRGHLSETEYEVLEKAIASAEKPVHVSKMTLHTTLDPADLLDEVCVRGVGACSLACGRWCVPTSHQAWARFILRDLDADAQSRVKNAAQARVFTRGDVIFEQGSLCDGLYVLVKGKVSLYPADNVDRLTPHRRSVSVSTPVEPECKDLFGRTKKVDLHPGDVIGALSLLSSRSNVFRGGCRVLVASWRIRAVNTVPCLSQLHAKPRRTPCSSRKRLFSRTCAATWTQPQA